MSAYVPSRSLDRYFAQLNLADTWQQWTLAWAQSFIAGDDRTQAGDDIRSTSFIESALLDHFSRFPSPELEPQPNSDQLLPEGRSAISLALEAFRLFATEHHPELLARVGVTGALDDASRLPADMAKLADFYEKAKKDARPALEPQGHSEFTLPRDESAASRLLRARVVFRTVGSLSRGAPPSLSAELADDLHDACQFVLHFSSLASNPRKFWDGLEGALALSTRRPFDPEIVEEVVRSWGRDLGSRALLILARRTLDRALKQPDVFEVGGIHAIRGYGRVASSSDSEKLAYAIRRTDDVLKQVDSQRFFSDHLRPIADSEFADLYGKMSQPSRSRLLPYEAGERLLGRERLHLFKASALDGFSDARAALSNRFTDYMARPEKGRPVDSFPELTDPESSQIPQPVLLFALGYPTTGQPKSRASLVELVALLEKAYGNLCVIEDRHLTLTEGHGEHASDPVLIKRAELRRQALGRPDQDPPAVYCYLATQAAHAAELSGVNDRFCIFEADQELFTRFNQQFGLNPAPPLAIIPSAEIQSTAPEAPRAAVLGFG